MKKEKDKPILNQRQQELQDRDKIFKDGFDMGFEAGIKEERKEILILIKQLERKLNSEVKE